LIQQSNSKSIPKCQQIVVEEVGARFRGHASFFDLMYQFISADLAIEDLLLLVKDAISLQ